VQWVENTFTGLGHLEGETVSVLGTDVDDVTSENDDETVASGTIVLSGWVRKAIAGLSYRYTLRPMRLDVPTRSGSMQGSTKKIHHIVASFYNTLGAQYGKSLSDLKDFTFPSSTTLYTGDMKAVFDGGYSVDDDLYISGNGSFPCTLRALIVRMEKTGQ